MAGVYAELDAPWRAACATATAALSFGGDAPLLDALRASSGAAGVLHEAPARAWRARQLRCAFAGAALRAVERFARGTATLGPGARSAWPPHRRISGSTCCLCICVLCSSPCSSQGKQFGRSLLYLMRVSQLPVSDSAVRLLQLASSHQAAWSHTGTSKLQAPCPHSLRPKTSDRVCIGVL